MDAPFIKACIAVVFALLGYQLYKKSGFNLSYIKRCITPVSFLVSSHIDTYRLNAVMDGIKRKHQRILIIAFAIEFIFLGIVSWLSLAFLGGYLAAFLIYKTMFCFSAENCANLCQTFEPFAHPGGEIYIRSSILSLVEDSDTEKSARSYKRRKNVAGVALLALFISCLFIGLNSEDETMQPISKPVSGTILSGREYHNASEITVHASGGQSCVVSLKSANGYERLSFFVRAGDTVTVGVPEEHLYVYFASGSTWYGYSESLMFGKNTDYSKDNQLVDFSRYTWEYTLYKTSSGNFTETPCSKNEFFS